VVVVMVMMVDVMVMMVVMVMMHGLGHRSGGSGSGGRRVLRHCVAGEAQRENRRSGKGLDHGRKLPVVGNPNGSLSSIEVAA
jgi:hypothetical protein